ncbi:hypothetical protein ACJIZ3_014568 [Penstemon smallii]|uniref:Transcription elongation factor Eaf N-terminal domain-containing protein n=1 Tax=Penstemon smallii TaxID=265156 RepID=A0ABD3RUI1_9LAMI
MAGLNNSDEPSTAPQADRWYNLTLGSSFKDPSSKFCTLRYDFKPASIDKDRRGTLHKSKDNKVTVEFQNNQPGKPKMVFEGSSEDYKENDAVLLFDGQSFRLERLHRAVKRLKHNRMQGESTDASSPPVVKGSKHQPLNKDTLHTMPVEVERIEIGDFKNSDAKSRHEKTVEPPAARENSPNPSPDLMDIFNTDDDNNAAADGNNIDVKEYETGNIDVKEYDSGNIDVKEYDTGSIDVKEYDTGIDINIPHQTDIDDEIADVDVSDDEGNKGPNAAEALRAQVNAEERKAGTSSSSSSSGSDSSGSGSGSGSSSSSSDSESSDGDSVSVTSI